MGLTFMGGVDMVDTAGLAATFARGVSFTDPSIGGVGNGSTDNTAAWNTAMALMAARGGGTLFFPAGIYLINGTTDFVPGGVWLVGEGFDYHTPANSSDRPVKMSVIRAGAAMTRLVQLGNDATVSTPGATGASVKNLVIDGAGLATVTVKTAARRNIIDHSQVGYATTTAVQMSGQNGHVSWSVIDQANAGDCVLVDRYADNKVFFNQLRQPGTTGACVRVYQAEPYSVDMVDIVGNHMWAGQNGTPAAAEGLVVIERQVRGILIQQNTIEGVNGPEILLKTNGATQRDILIQGNRFYNNSSSADNTYPVVKVDGTGAATSINVHGNSFAGWDTTHRYKALVEFGASLLYTNRFTITDNVGSNAAALTSGTAPNRPILSNNIFHDGSASVHGEDQNSPRYLTSGQSTMDRDAAVSDITPGGDNFRLAYFTPVKTETVNNLRMVSGATAATSMTLARMGLYSVADNGDLTLLASTTSDTSLFSVANTAYTKALDTGVKLRAGTRYAVALLCVGTGTGTVKGVLGSSTEFGVAPRVCGFNNPQSNLPSTLASGSVVNSSAKLYAVLTP